ncbi:uncharacterized protein LOC128235206 [Mya arenaria]|uniref:uncharacterized protein LOC128235206 n=1 Tax=Mya arenaria TaxID=6604 RepID=UPI0022E2EBFE|nr:uncharacterized protein LOC128235206 [Mya arenaria]
MKMLEARTLFLFLLHTLFCTNSGLQTHCEIRDSRIYVCIDGIPSDPCGYTYIIVNFTSYHESYTIANETFLGDTWLEVERFEITKSPAIHTSIEIRPHAFTKLEKLQHLSLHLFTSVVNIFNDSFTGLISLRTLDLTEWQRFDDQLLHDMFSSNESFPKLQTLLLTNSGIQSTVFNFDDVLLEQLFVRPLKALYLQAIKANIDLYVFSRVCGSLEYVNVSESILRIYDRERVQYAGVCDHLKVLDVSGMHVKSMYCFTNVYENAHFTVNESHLKNFSPIRNVENVTYDRLCTFTSSVSFISITADVNITLHVKSIRSRYNSFDIFDVALSMNNCPLEQIDLAENGISFLSPKFVSQCTRITEVNLAGNRLSKMSEYNTTQFIQLFMLLSNLSVINLAGNGLNVLHEGLFSSNKMLAYLDLSQNEFKVFALSLTNLKNLALLSLSSNNLNLKYATTRLYLTEYLNNSKSNKLMLADNPFACYDCDDLEGIKWLVQNMKSIVDSDSVHCSADSAKVQLVKNETVTELEDICKRPFRQKMITIILCCSSFLVLILSLYLAKKSFQRYNQHRKQKQDECRLLHEAELEKETVSVLKQEQHANTFAVFLSFSGNDKDFVKTFIFESLNEKLKSRVGTDRDLVFFSEIHMEFGKLTNVIKDGLRKCKSMLFILSDSSCRPDNDNWCIFEFNTAMELNIPVTLMVKEYVNESTMHPDIRKYFKNNSRIMWTKDETGTYQLESSWDVVCSAILRSTTDNTM